MSQAIEGFLLHKRVSGLSPPTLELYQRQIAHLAQYLSDPHIEDITTDDLRRFFDYLRSDYTPKRWNGDTRPLSSRSIHNYWIALHSFWHWAKVELNAPDAIAPIPPPKAQDAEITPLNLEEIEALLK